MKSRMLEATLIAHCLASLAHFVHNGVYIEQYPNLPDAITIASIAWTWLGIAIIGAVGYLTFRTGRSTLGLLLIALYAIAGFDGFAHYSLAAMNAHSTAMNITIWLEALTGATLLGVVALHLLRIHRGRQSASPSW